MRSVALLGMILAGYLTGANTGHAQSDVTPEPLRFFETSIRPLLVEKCQKCHRTEKQ